MSYLCIDEDGELRVAQGEPNEDVFQAVEEGVLTCVRWNKEADCFEQLTVSAMEWERIV